MGKSCLKNPMVSPMKPSPVSLQKSRIRNITGKVCIPKIGKKLNDAVKKSTQASDSHYSFSKCKTQMLFHLVTFISILPTSDTVGHH
mmetsp:Transcript_9320/g.8991  ORF Transcript_9320/g.8991 Transcript_9320/m.8991 type:complete len:87 (-) Transcript_9320:498-758(-)